VTEASKNYYEILEIPVDSSPEEILRGYQRAKNAYSQDSLALYSLMSQNECDEILNLIEEAYTILSDPNKRRQYDTARGFNPHGLRHMSYQAAAAVPTMSESIGIEHKIHTAVDSTSQNSMTKIVAKKRFSLDYDQDPDFEKEIEQATDFNGEFLQRIREYKGVDLARLADMTKVSKTYLRYIEEEAFEKLPAPVYVRGFVHQYAKCLKLNPDMVATSYLYRLKKARGDS
jgi:curved DNA-binding protein CbpA